MSRLTLLALATFLTSFFAMPDATAQMRNFEQSMSKMQNKLPTTVFDGTALNVSNYEELQKVGAFLGRFQTNAKAALDAWNQLGRGQNEERRLKLNANIQYHDALLKAYQEKQKTIQAPAAAAPVKVRTVAISDAFTGPGATRDAPYLVDTIGERSTIAKVWGHPGNRAKASRYNLKLEFLVHYNDIAQDDVVMVQPHKGAKRLGAPTPCSPSKVYKEWNLALFKCDAPGARSDYSKLLNTAGDLSVKLTYRKVIEGKEFKNFANLLVRAKKLKKGAANNPTVAWGSDHDVEMGPSTLTESITGTQSGWGYELLDAMGAVLNKAETHALIHTTFKTEGKHMPTRMACMYNGKRVAEAQGTKDQSYETWSYKAKGNMAHDTHTWERHSFRLHMLHPHANPDGTKQEYSIPQHYMNENPGKYRCVVTAGGEIVKEMHFEVGADGEIKQPACQAKSMNTLRSITLLPTKAIKPSTRSWDKRIAAKRGYAGGVTWASGCPPKR